MELVKKIVLWIIAAIGIAFGIASYLLHRRRLRKTLDKLISTERKMRELEEKRKKLEEEAAKLIGREMELREAAEQIRSEIEEKRKEIGEIDDAEEIADRFDRLGY